MSWSTLKTLVILVVVLGFADHALAWGPATHIGLASSILDNLALVPAGIAAILARNKLAYLYGNIAADVVFAKRLSRVKQFCHHWSTGFRLFETAQDDPGRSFAYGYLSHLAADTVAHGKFVPRQIAVSETSVNFGHFYWELRAENLAGEPSWRALKELIDNNHLHHDQTLSRHLTETFLPFTLNRRVFDLLNGLAVRQGFRRTMGVWSRCSRWYLSPSLMRDYQSECIDRIRSILNEGKQSALLREDPNGTSALMDLRVHRRGVRRRRRRGLPVEQRRFEKAVSLAPQAWRMPTPLSPHGQPPAAGSVPTAAGV